MTETLAYGYSFESTQQELSNEYQHDRVLMVFEKLCVLVLWTKVVSAFEGLSGSHRLVVECWGSHRGLRYKTQLSGSK